jgi:DedD protein
MARPISDEELQLKKRARRRLVGAIVLVTVVAVVLPMVLDSEPKPVSQNVNIQIPSPDAGEYKPKAAAPPVEIEKQASAPADSPPARKESPAAAATATPPAPAVKSADTSPAAKAAPAGGGFVVQVAALADAGRAKQLEKQMASAGVKTYTEVVSTQSGEVTRVRAGPYPTREAAEKARTQLKKAGLDGKVVPK